ncbi:MarR family transcriptional regulator [Brevundimonas sp. 2R-24]|uniref:MarR family transcriptional regulator n=1 Tax=Peiella sedimenti TaxID=3061083 RepID=A0ABT8SJX8_9CAUL|nr:MarR family transcriptional regulator [Caulobacteraceae bacterium XZ-24]
MQRHKVRRRRRNSCLQTLELLRAEAPGLSLTEALVFLYVAENEGLNMREVAQVCGLSDSTASRTTRALADGDDPLSLPPARGWIEVRRNPADGRGRTLYLTESGRGLVDAIDRALADAITITGEVAA